MNIAAASLTHRRLYGSTKDTKRFAQELANVLQEIRDNGLTTEDVLEQCRKYCDIDLEVQDDT